VVMDGISPPQADAAVRSGTYSTDLVRLPGEAISSEVGGMSGHGTYESTDGELVASVGGVLEEVGKLKIVRPLKSRYVGQIGDVVVGRVIEVAQKRWKLDINSSNDGTLMLSSVNLPDAAQRRRTAEDQLQMRQFFVENDLVSAEVQEARRDGQVMLHTRSTKYGKLQYGCLVRVPPALMKRLPQHFNTLSCGINAIFGMNGFIWLSPPDEERSSEDGSSWRERLCRVRNALEILSQGFVQISPAAIMAIYEESLTRSLQPMHMLDPTRSQELVSHARSQQQPDT